MRDKKETILTLGISYICGSVSFGKKIVAHTNILYFNPPKMILIVSAISGEK